MSRSGNDLMTELMLSEPTIAKLTESAVAEALAGFELKPKREMLWIARAIQGAVYATLPSPDERSDRPSNAEVRDEILKLARDCSKLWLDLSDRSHAADSAIWDRAFRNWISRVGDNHETIKIGEPSDYTAFSDALRQLEWISSFLKGAAVALERQPPNWRRAELREQRVIRAQFLSAIYEEAFGVQPTVNTWPTAKSLGPWADFYQRIVALAFGERATPNLEAVLDEARRRDKSDRVTFGPGVIPK